MSPIGLCAIGKVRVMMFAAFLHGGNFSFFFEGTVYGALGALPLAWCNLAYDGV